MVDDPNAITRVAKHGSGNQIWPKTDTVEVVIGNLLNPRLLEPVVREDLWIGHQSPLVVDDKIDCSHAANEAGVDLPVCFERVG
ncbi:MAG: hypothetical protein JW395_3424 [Nitrospira sp.]|nr:hypothetical protein [Nitrospira sp.]